MTHTIELMPDLEEIAARQAHADGKSIDEYLPELLSSALLAQSASGQRDQADALPRTGADLIAQWEQEGAFLPHEDLPDSPALARHLRERAQRRGS